MATNGKALFVAAERGSEAGVMEQLAMGRR
jgi:hypothetical protein